jgi:hypothetical protein
VESENKIWNDIFVTQEQYNKLALSEIKNYDKFFIYSIIANSTAIEGSTLTEEDTQLLFDEDVVTKGKPMTAHLMNLDLKAAYECASVEAVKKRNVTVDFVKQLNSLVMKNTDGVYSMPTGAFDSTKGDYRLCGVRAGFDGRSYIESLTESREVESVAPFRNFMAQQHLKTLKKEIDDYSKSQKQTKYFTTLI